MAELTPIRRLMVTAGRCALRVGPLPRDLVAQLAADHHAIENAKDEAERALCSAVFTVTQFPDRPEPVAMLQAARDLLANILAEKAPRGTPPAEPSYWWQQGNMA